MEGFAAQDKPVHQLRQAVAAARKAGDKTEIARLCASLADLEPDRQIYQGQAAVALMQAGDLEEAAVFAQAALALDPDDFQSQMLVGRIQLLRGDAGQAMQTFAPALDHPDSNAEIHHLASLAARELGDAGFAIELATTARDMQPDRPVRALHLLGLLAQNGRVVEAQALADHLQSEANVAALAMHRLSVELIRAGDPISALDRLDGALVRAPGDPELLLQKAIALRQLKQFPQAIDALQQILSVDPAQMRARQLLMGIYRETQQTSEALQVAAGLVADAPGVSQYQRSLQMILTTAQGPASPDQDSLPDIASLKTGRTIRTERPRRSFVGAMQRKWQIFAALVMREIRTRYGRNRLSFLWALLEPLTHVAVLAVVFWVTMRSNPPLGDNFLLFYFTGVQPFLMFSKIGGQGGGAVAGGRGVLQLSTITPMDLIAAKAAVEVFIAGCVVIVFGAIIYSWSGVGFPTRPVYLLPGVLFSVGLGIGFAGLNAVLREVSHVFALINTGLLRALYFTSGVFFLPGAMPEQIRDIMLWNPLTHISDLWRLAYFPLYDAPFADPSYAGLFALGLLVVGVGAVTLATPKLRSLK